MNITIIKPFENSITQRGNRIPLLAKTLINSGHKITYITSNFYHAEKRFFSKKEIFNVKKRNEYKIIFLSVPGYNANYSLSRIITHKIFAIKSLIYLMSNQSPDFVIIASQPPELLFSVAITKPIKKFDTIIDVIDIWPDAFPQKNILYLFFYIYCNFLQYFSLPFQKNYVYTSPKFLDWIKRYKKNSKTKFITLGYDSERWKDFKPIKTIESNKKIVYVGNLAQTINLYPLIDGIKNFENWNLTIIGGGDRLQEIKRYVKRKNIKNVFFTGFVAKDKLPTLLKEYDITTIPMIHGTLPNKLFDSIGSYRPILSFGDNDTTRFVNENKIGWAIPFKKNNVINFLQKIDDAEIIEKSNNIEKIRKEYSKNRLLKSYLKYIEELSNKL